MNTRSVLASRGTAAPDGFSSDTVTRYLVVADRLNGMSEGALIAS